VGDASFQQNAKDMLSHMIDQHFNHPSIVLWGLGNEDDWPDEYPSVDHAAIRAFVTELRGLAHQMDNSRRTPRTLKLCCGGSLSERELKSLALPISTRVASFESPKMATGRKPTPEISSTGT
jgi:hypothetical protein